MNAWAMTMLGLGQRVGVAVSGGADSVCLLHLLLELAPARDLKLKVLHVDHKLRGIESTQDAEFVRDLAAELRLPFDLFETDVKTLPGNLEQSARNVRNAFFRDQIRRGAVDCVALGHTRSDQAETVLFRFLRGAGTAGLAGIRPVTSDGFVRPLLDVSRGEVESWLRARGIAWRDDSTNADVGFARNRIRHTLLPALTREWNPLLPETLANLAKWALAEEAYWTEEIDRLAAHEITRRGPAVLVNAPSVRRLPLAVQRRLIRRAIERSKGDLRSIDFRHIERVVELVSAPKGHARLQIPGTDVLRSFDWVSIMPSQTSRVPAHHSSPDFEFPVHIPGTIQLAERGPAIHLRIHEVEAIYNKDVNCLDLDRFSGSLAVRNWRPGDRYIRAGHAGEEKIKHLFQEARIPVWERGSWPVITQGQQIVWARTFGPGSNYAVTLETQRVLLIQETAAAGLAGECWNRDPVA